MTKYVMPRRSSSFPLTLHFFSKTTTMTDPFMPAFIDSTLLEDISDLGSASVLSSETLSSAATSPSQSTQSNTKSKRASTTERSIIWKEYTKELNDNGEIIRIKCNHC